MLPTAPLSICCRSGQRVSNSDLIVCFLWWSGGGSNSRPSHCERDALPAELPPQFLPRCPPFGRTGRTFYHRSCWIATRSAEIARSYFEFLAFQLADEALQRLALGRRQRFEPAADLTDLTAPDEAQFDSAAEFAAIGELHAAWQHRTERRGINVGVETHTQSAQRDVVQAAGAAAAAR